MKYRRSHSKTYPQETRVVLPFMRCGPQLNNTDLFTVNNSSYVHLVPRQTQTEANKQKLKNSFALAKIHYSIVMNRIASFTLNVHRLKETSFPRRN